MSTALESALEGIQTLKDVTSLSTRLMHGSYQPEEMIAGMALTVHPEDRKNDSCLPTDATSGRS